MSLYIMDSWQYLLVIVAAVNKYITDGFQTPDYTKRY